MWTSYGYKSSDNKELLYSKSSRKQKESEEPAGP